MTLASLEERHLTIPSLMDLRVYGPKNSGIFPEGTPTYLAFSTGCIRHLLRR
jgi:hypothetical protein